MLKGKQKKLDVNKDGKISGDDFAMLRGKKQPKEMKHGGMHKMNKKKIVKAESGKMIAKDDTTEYVKRRKKLGGAGTIFKAESGKMVTEAEAPDLGGMMGAEAAGDIEGSINPYLKNKRPLPMLRDSAIERIASRRPPLPMLQEPQQLKKDKSITPKERREKDIAKRAKKKMGGGMMSDGVSRKGMGIEKRMGGGMMSDGIANRGSGIEMKSKGGMVRGQGIAIRGTKFKGIF